MKNMFLIIPRPPSTERDQSSPVNIIDTQTSLMNNYDIQNDSAIVRRPTRAHRPPQW